MSHQTVITTFEVTPGTCADLIDELSATYEEVVSRSQGFIRARLHVNDAQTRIASISHWHDRQDFLAMLRTDEMRERNRLISSLCRSFEPVLYEAVAEYGENAGHPS